MIINSDKYNIIIVLGVNYYYKNVVFNTSMLTAENSGPIVGRSHNPIVIQTHK